MIRTKEEIKQVINSPMVRFGLAGLGVVLWGNVG